MIAPVESGFPFHVVIAKRAFSNVAPFFRSIIAWWDAVCDWFLFPIPTIPCQKQSSQLFVIVALSTTSLALGSTVMVLLRGICITAESVIVSVAPLFTRTFPVTYLLAFHVVLVEITLLNPGIVLHCGKKRDSHIPRPNVAMRKLPA